MRKFAFFFTLALTVSMFVGCTSNGTSTSWCRLGSLFPTAKSRQNSETVFLTGASKNCVSQCDPCEPAACQPCEPAACNPCEPACDPCASRTVTTGAIIPHPAN